jgi:hypothetical protein
MQEIRKDAVDRLRRGRDLEDAGVGSPQPWLARSASRRPQDGAAIAERPLAFPGQDQPAASAIKQPDAELRFEVANLARARLRDSRRSDAFETVLARRR